MHMDTAEALRLFRIWFEEPISRMSNDDGFVAMMVALTLFERFVLAKYPSKSYPPKEWPFHTLVAQELHLDSTEDGADFWKAVRDGLLHQGMPKDAPDVRGRKVTEKEKFYWRFSSGFGPLPVVSMVNGKRVLDIDPLKFAHHVVNEFIKQPELLLHADEFPFASVIPLEPGGLPTRPDAPMSYPQQSSFPTQATGTMPANWDPSKSSPF